MGPSEQYSERLEARERSQAGWDQWHARLGNTRLAFAAAFLMLVWAWGTRWNWFDDQTIKRCAIVAGVSGVLFIARSLTYRFPVVDLRALANRNFSLGCILSFVTGMGLFAPIFLTPLFLGYVRGFSASQTGIAIFSTGAASLAGVPFYLALARRMDLRWLMMFGLASFGIAMWSYSLVTHDWGGDQLLLPQVLRGFPQVFAVAPAVSLGLGSLPLARLKYASGLFNMMRNLGGAVGIALCGAILNSKTNAHFLDIASTLTPANGASQHLIASLSSKLGDLLGSTTAGSAAALQQLRALAYREASTMAYADAFRAMMIVCLAAACLVPLLKNVAPPPAPSADAH